MTTIEREAQDWVIRLGSRQATAADADAFKQWCARSRRHATAFAQARRVWLALGPAAQRSRTTEPRGREPLMGRRALLGGALAASMAWLALRPPLQLWPAMADLSADFHTGTGEQRQVAMGAGVVVEMNTQTRISRRSNAGGQTFELLTGEAEVKAGNGSVAVIAAGGAIFAEQARFNVRHTDTAVCVTCLEGALRIEHLREQAILTAGHQLVYNHDDFGAAHAVDAASVSAWRQRQLVFNQAPLAEVVAEVNRYRPGKLIITSATLGRRRVQASFSLDRLDDVVALIRDVYGAQLTRLPGGIVLMGAASA